MFPPREPCQPIVGHEAPRAVLSRQPYTNEAWELQSLVGESVEVIWKEG